MNSGEAMASETGDATPAAQDHRPTAAYFANGDFESMKDDTRWPKHAVACLIDCGC